MRHLFSAKFLPLAIISFTLVGAASALRAESPQEAVITIADGKYCLVEEARILCADVLKHLRDVLKLPAGSLVRVRAGKTSTYESTAKVFELLQKSEYKHKLGFINFSHSPKD
jgi:biopolymer transport protein ExbD